MEIKSLYTKAKESLAKYKYALIVLMIGIALLLIPEKRTLQSQQVPEANSENYELKSDNLSKILQSVEGAGHVQVLLSIASGEETLYQTNQDASVSENNTSTKTETVILTDANRIESGLIKQINPPKYMGAIVVCQGADSPTVRFAITQAVSRITGLGADNICVLKMK